LDQTQDSLALADAALVKFEAALAENRVDEAIALAREAVGAASWSRNQAVATS